jgi:hypothetical protein
MNLLGTKSATAPVLGTGVANPATGEPTKSKNPDVEAAPDSLNRWTSHPIMRYGIGRFQFENGLLALSAEDDVEFRELLAQQPVSEQCKVRFVDLEAAEKLIASMRADSGGVTQGIDSSTGDRAKPAEVGKGVLGEDK